MQVLEIWLFRLALSLLLHWPAFGSLGPGAQHLFDFIYFAAVTFTTVGFGIWYRSARSGSSGTEVLTGFVLLTSSASFTYFEMQRFWRDS